MSPYGRIYLIGAALAIATELLAVSIAIHRKHKWITDPDDNVGAMVICALVWPVFLGVTVLVTVFYSLHQLVGVFAKPRVAPPIDEHLAAAEREVSELLDEGQK